MQDILDDLIVGDQQLLDYSFSEPYYHYRQKRNHVELTDIMEGSAPSLPSANLEDFHPWVGQQDEDMGNHSELKLLLVRLLEKSSGRYERRYVIDLLESFDSLDGNPEIRLSESTKALEPLLETYLTLCKAHVDDVYQTICDCLQAEISAMHRLARGAKMWPRLSTVSLIQYLAVDKIASLRDDWKACLIVYGVAISNLQRAERLLACIGNNSELLSEISNPGHRG